MPYKKIQQIEQSGYLITQGDLHEPIETEDGFMCQICSNDASGNFYGTGFMLCVLCADYVANVYTHMVSDKFATWKIKTPKSKRGDRSTRKPLSQSIKTSVLECDMYRCVSCGTHKELTVDHKLPLSKGGDDALSNLQTLCRTCNTSKGVKTMEEWLGGAK